MEGLENQIRKAYGKEWGVFLSRGAILCFTKTALVAVVRPREDTLCQSYCISTGLRELEGW